MQRTQLTQLSLVSVRPASKPTYGHELTGASTHRPTSDEVWPHMPYSGRVRAPVPRGIFVQIKNVKIRNHPGDPYPVIKRQREARAA
jgi:hypothetical protein